MTTVFPPGAGPQAFAFPGAGAVFNTPPPTQATAGSRYQAPEPPAEAEEDAAPRATPDQARQSVEEANKVLEGLGYRLSFGFYEGTGEFYAQLVDRETNEVIKMIPSEGVLKFHARFQEALGRIIDERV
jgi:flagellar protein FlaG